MHITDAAPERFRTYDFQYEGLNLTFADMQTRNNGFLDANEIDEPLDQILSHLYTEIVEFTQAPIIPQLVIFDSASYETLGELADLVIYTMTACRALRIDVEDLLYHRLQENGALHLYEQRSGIKSQHVSRLTDVQKIYAALYPVTEYLSDPAACNPYALSLINTCIEAHKIKDIGNVRQCLADILLLTVFVANGICYDLESVILAKQYRNEQKYNPEERKRLIHEEGLTSAQAAKAQKDRWDKTQDPIFMFRYARKIPWVLFFAQGEYDFTKRSPEYRAFILEQFGIIDTA